MDRDYELNPGDGAFYGPKIDFHVTDALGRSWQLGTCQIDFFMPERFDLSYQGADNANHRPVMIHRALLGSMERFGGILIEHYGGRFPDWLAPTQALLLPVADRHVAAAEAMLAELDRGGVRARDRRASRVGRPQDPRRRARQGALHARRRRPRGGGGRRGGALPRRRRPRGIAGERPVERRRSGLVPRGLMAGPILKPRLYSAAMQGTKTTPRR